MANRDDAAILEYGVEAWNRWRSEVIVDGITDLSGTDLEGRNLAEIDFFETILTGANLRGADLHNANLIGAVLLEANLNKANLSEARLHSADLTNSQLNGAILEYADFTKANLKNADLQNSVLYSTNFTDVVLHEANLAYAECSGAYFVGLDLSNVRGLETIWHTGPSNLGIDTIFKTRNRLPEVFLRGCGIPEVLITYLPSMMPYAIEFYSCFISYSHTEKSFARQVHDTLQSRGIRCWLDEKQMNPGDDIYTEVDRGIRLWDKVLLCCSKSALTEKWWVDQEINKAVQKERDLMKERGTKVLSLIPLDVDGFLFSDDCDNPKADEIRSRIAADFKGWERDNAIFEREIERVIKALRTDGGKEPPPVSKL